MVIQVSSKSKSPASISTYLHANSICYLDAESPKEAINQLIESLSKDQRLKSKKEFYEAVLEREKTASTGIGMGVAIPHAKLSCYDDFFIALGILKKGIPWNSMDQADVQLIFLIGGPDDRQCHYLNLLSQLTLFLRDQGVRKKLLTITNPEQIIEIFKN